MAWLTKLQKWIFAALLVVLVGIPIAFSCQGAKAVDVSLHRRWTNSGDDGDVGRATYLHVVIDPDSSRVANHFWECDSVPGWPAPDSAGIVQEWNFTVNVYSGRTYYSAIVAVDEVGNRAAVGRIVSYYVPDIYPPDPVEKDSVW